MNTRFFTGLLFAWFVVVMLLPAAAPSPGEDKITPEAAPRTTEAAGARPDSGQPAGKAQPSWLNALWFLALPPLLLVGWGALLALLTLGHTFWPRLIQREYEVLTERPGKSLGWGVLWMVGFLFLAALFSKAAGLGPIVAVLLGLATLSGMLLGLTGTAVSLGGQALALARRDGASPLARLAMGTTLIALVPLIPFPGLLLLLYFVLISLGAFRLAVTSLAPPAPAAEEVWPSPASEGVME